MGRVEEGEGTLALVIKKVFSICNYLTLHGRTVASNDSPREAFVLQISKFKEGRPFVLFSEMEERKARGNSRGKGTGGGRGRGRGRGSGRDSDKEKGIAENQDEIENGEEEEGGVGTGDSDVRSYKYYREVNANRIGDERGR